MAAIGVFDVTKRTAVVVTSVRNNASGPIVGAELMAPKRMTFASVVRNKTAGPMVAEHSQLMPSKRTAFASVRYNTSGPVDVARLMPTKRAAFASVRNKTAYPIVAKQKRAAYVTVRNRSHHPLVGVSVVHKYSSLYKHQHQWGLIRPGEIADDKMVVEYNTGFLTTGLDWWVVTWFSEDMKTLYYSDPNNFGGLLDTLESYAPAAIETAAGAIVGLATFATGPGAVVAGTAAAVAAQATTSALFSSETIDGFKEHMLTVEDEGRVTEIIINPDLSITFTSPSGASNTVSSSRPAPGQH